MSDWKIYLLILISFALGFFLGGWSVHDLVRRYKKAQGLYPDPFDGSETTRLEKFIATHKEGSRER